jgi:methylated-DNA-[protein]-cysteine S-methyltransferase
MTTTTLTASYTLSFASPIGELVLLSDGTHLTGLLLPGSDRPLHGEPRHDLPIFAETERQLREYFAGGRHAFDLPMAQSGTPFQQRVWNELARIPYGHTASYADIAARLGQPGAARAVGSANGRNRIAIIVPCHRVIAADGTLGGYGGGLEAKRFLLALEGVHVE